MENYTNLALIKEEDFNQFHSRSGYQKTGHGNQSSIQGSQRRGSRQRDSY